MKSLLILTFLAVLFVSIAPDVSCAEKTTDRDSQVRIGGMTVDNKNQAVTPMGGIGRRGGGPLARLPLSTKIIHQKEWDRIDWICFVLSAISATIFITCLFCFALSTCPIPEPILFNTALLSTTVGLGCWLRLFNLPELLARGAGMVCLIFGILSVVNLTRSYLRFLQEQKKPDIFT